MREVPLPPPPLPSLAFDDRAGRRSSASLDCTRTVSRFLLPVSMVNGSLPAPMNDQSTINNQPTNHQQPNDYQQPNDHLPNDHQPNDH